MDFTFCSNPLYPGLAECAKRLNPPPPSSIEGEHGVLDHSSSSFQILQGPRITSSKFLALESWPRILAGNPEGFTPPYLPGATAHSAGGGPKTPPGPLSGLKNSIFRRSMFWTIFGTPFSGPWTPKVGPEILQMRFSCFFGYHFGSHFGAFFGIQNGTKNGAENGAQK